MIQHKLQNIKELETDKAHKTFKTTIVPFLNEFLINLLSDPVEVVVDFDSWSWPENVPSEDASQ